MGKKLINILQLLRPTHLQSTSQKWQNLQSAFGTQPSCFLNVLLGKVNQRGIKTGTFRKLYKLYNRADVHLAFEKNSVEFYVF